MWFTGSQVPILISYQLLLISKLQLSLPTFFNPFSFLALQGELCWRSSSCSSRRSQRRLRDSALRSWPWDSCFLSPSVSGSIWETVRPTYPPQRHPSLMYATFNPNAALTSFHVTSHITCQSLILRKKHRHEMTSVVNRCSM